MELTNPCYVSTSEIKSKVGTMELTNPCYVSTSEVTSKVPVPGSSLTFTDHSRGPKRVAIVIACIVVMLAIAGLSAAMALAFLNIRDLQLEVAELQGMINRGDAFLQAFQDNFTQAKVDRLTQDTNRLAVIQSEINCTVVELHEVIRNRTENRGLPGMYTPHFPLSVSFNLIKSGPPK